MGRRASASEAAGRSLGVAGGLPRREGCWSPLGKAESPWLCPLGRSHCRDSPGWFVTGCPLGAPCVPQSRQISLQREGLSKSYGLAFPAFFILKDLHIISSPLPQGWEIYDLSAS